MNPKNGIAVEGVTVVNANLYFFSWLAFAACLFLSGNLAQEAAGYDVTQTPPKTARWYGLCASSLVVMGTSIRIFRTIDCGDGLLSDTKFCKRTKLGIALGTVGFFLAGAMVYLAQRGVTLMIETVATTLLLTFWCFGVGYLTFGTSPGAQIGNLYFATWTSFILVVFLFGQCFRELMAARAQTAADMAGGSEPPTPHAESVELPEEDQI